MSKLSHVDKKGQVKMVDVGNKSPMHRYAKASGKISLAKKTIKLIRANQIAKGDVLSVAKIAGIQAAKQVPHLIPLCHSLNLSHIDLSTKILSDSILITSEVRSIGQTGVEMEALTAVNLALLTIYDMCKAVDKNMIMSEIKLIVKVKT